MPESEEDKDNAIYDRIDVFYEKLSSEGKTLFGVIEKYQDYQIIQTEKMFIEQWISLYKSFGQDSPDINSLLKQLDESVERSRQRLLERLDRATKELDQ